MTAYEKHEVHDEHDEANWNSTMTRGACGMYVLILVILGVSLPIGHALRFEVGMIVYRVDIFHILLYVVSIAFLAFIYIYVIPRRTELTNEKPPDDQVTGVSIHYLSTNGNGGEKVVQIRQNGEEPMDKNETDVDVAVTPLPPSDDQLPAKPGETQSEASATSSNSEPSEVDDVITSDVKPEVTFAGTGLNFYLIMGTIGFGLGSIIHDLLKMIRVGETSDSFFDCFGPLPLVVAIIHFVFVVWQTYFLCAHNTIIVNMKKPLIRLGLAHLLATNICIWMLTIVMETSDEFHHHFSHESDHGSDHGDSGHGNDTTGAHHGYTTESYGHHDTTTYDSHASDDGHHDGTSACVLDGSSIVAEASPYLFPCTIEYSLIAAAVAYKVFSNVGTHPEEHKREVVHLRDPRQCHRATWGLACGVVIFLLTCAAMVVFFYLTNARHDATSARFVYYGTECILLALGLVAVMWGFRGTRKLHFTVMHEGFLDAGLLILAMSGVLFNDAFIFVSSVTACYDGGFGDSSWVSVLTTVFSVIQTCSQTVFILDGLHRTSRNKKQAASKPGRFWVTMLLVINFSLWVVNTFMVRKSDARLMHEAFYGVLGWSIISHMAAPLVIFYRYHSTVCLSDVWLHAYSIDKKHV